MDRIPHFVGGLFDRSAQQIEVARACVESGRSVDLSGLDREIETLCGEVLRLPVADRIEVKPRLLGLVEELGRLVEALEMQHKHLAIALRNIASRRNAVSAYGKGATSRTAGPKKGRPEKKP